MRGDNVAIRMKAGSTAAQEYFDHSSARRIDTNAYMLAVLRKEHPKIPITITLASAVNLLAYAAAGYASAKPILDQGETELSYSWKGYAAPNRRLDGEVGGLYDIDYFNKYEYQWKESTFIVYLVDGRDGSSAFPTIRTYFILGDKEKADALIMAAGSYGTTLHDAIWVFDQGYWQQDQGLWKSIQKASWDDVILDEDMKRAVIDDVERFFDSRDTYSKLRVPWKRGVIYYGPPGNGKTISIKAMMNSLYKRTTEVPTLYVKTLTSFAGPEASIRTIFEKARQEAPCYLVFEDIDSIVTDQVRSFFLNEVDGLSSNDGIFMVGSTNHLDRLDPGLAKRPSRFDRKYLFPDPDLPQRVAYCTYWQKKLSDNKDIEFPDELVKAIAEITDDFSFAYIQEAFVATLLSIAARDKHTSDEHSDLDKYLLWREIKKQVKLLRDELGEEKSKFKALPRLRPDEPYKPPMILY